MNEHGYCPACKADLDGGDIKQTFLDQGRSEEEASRVASYYGYGIGRTKWGRETGLIENDKLVAYLCPDCNHRWKRSQRGKG